MTLVGRKVEMEREQMVELVFQDWISWVAGFYWGGCGQKLKEGKSRGLKRELLVELVFQDWISWVAGFY